MAWDLSGVAVSCCLAALTQGSAGLDVPDGSVAWLAVDAGCWLRAPSEDCWPELLHIVLKCGSLRVVRLAWHLPDSVPLEQAAQGSQVEAGGGLEFHRVTSVGWSSHKPSHFLERGVYTPLLIGRNIEKI